MLPLKKIYLDSKFKTSDSRSTSDFKCELKESILLPANTIAYIDNICIPHAWRTIEENINDKLYIQVTNSSQIVSNKPNECRIVQLTPGNYNISTLANEIQTKANNAFSTSTTPTHFNISPNLVDNTILINPAVSSIEFKILTDYDLEFGLPDTIDVAGSPWLSAWTGPSFDPKNTQDMNEMINNYAGPSVFATTITPFKSSYVDLQSNKNVYLHSGILSSFGTCGVLGERTVLKKIPVNVGNNQMIIDNITSSSDWLDCSKMTLKTLDFQIKNVKGQIIPLHNTNVSFSIVFDKYKDTVQ